MALTMVSVGSAATAASTGASPASIQYQEWWIGTLGVEVNAQTAGGAWQITKGDGVTVAVIDQGVDASVPDLSGALVPGFTIGGSGSPDVVHDDEGHGTQMAAYIAGRGTGPGMLGVAPQAKIMPVYLAANDDDSTTQALTQLAAMANPPQIVNMSFDSIGPCPASLQSAVKTAVDQGIILVAASGNNGDNGNFAASPANCAGVIAAGAFDAYGKPWASTQRQPYVSIGGPGVAMVAYDKHLTVGTADGTSNSAAIVSGELALLRAHWPRMASRQLVAKLFATTAKHTYSGPGYGSPNDVLGYGIGVVNAALRDSVPATAPNAVYDELAKISTGTNSSAQPTGSVAVNFPGATSSNKSASGSNSGLIIAIIVGALLLLAIIAIAIIIGRRRTRTRAGSDRHPT